MGADGVEIAISLEIAGVPREVSFQSAASRVALVGPSGIGKSTVVRALLGLYPCRGRVRFGAAVLQDGERGLPVERRGIGWVPQDVLLWPHRTVAQHLRGGALDAAALEALGLRRLEERKPATLSGGERQRVAIARALCTARAALVLDEPLSALDRASRVGIAEVIRRFCAERALPLLLISHDEADVSTLAESVFVFGEDGVRPA